MRPERIDQIIPSVVEHDAVSNHTFAAQRLLQSMGFVSEIYADIIGPGAEEKALPLDRVPRLGDGQQWVLYQSSIGSRAAEVFARHPGVKLLDYHNITPAELVERWLPALGAESRLGRRQLAELAPLVAFSFADSAFNASELTALGYRDARVVPVLSDSGNLAGEPDPHVLAHLGQGKGRSSNDWLFVGQLAPHKCQHDVIKAFACYQQVFDRDARLFLVGREMGDSYRRALIGFVRRLGLEDRVVFTGSISASSLAAHYLSCDVFVCCSAHEGFNVPIVEAMTRGMPVVAFRAGAVPDTLGDAGLLLEDKAAEVVASAVQLLRVDQELRAQCVERGRRRSAQFSLAQAESAFVSTMEAALARS